MTGFLKDRGWRILALVVLVNSLAIGLFVQHVIGDGMASTAIAGVFLSLGSAGTDSWEPMLKAIGYLRQEEGLQIYQKLFFEDKVKFQYPLTSLLPLDVFQRVSGLSAEQMYPLFNAMSWVSVVLTGVVTWLIFAGDPQDPRQAVRSRLATLLPILVITVTFYPLTKAWMLGQIQTWITLLVALALLAWRHKQPVLAGLLLGLCCAIKPQWAVIFLWGLLRRQWTFVIVGSLMFGTLAIAAILLYGLQNFMDYLSVLSYIGQRGESFFNNQSVNGLVNRLLFNGNNLKWVADAFPPFHPVVYAATLGSSIAILGFTLLWRRKERPEEMDLAFIVLGLTMASPIAWEHHYGILLPIFALMLKALLDRVPAPAQMRLLLLMGLSFVLASQNLSFVNYFRDTVLNVVQSYLLFGAVMALYLLYHLNKRNRVVDP